MHKIFAALRCLFAVCLSAFVFGVSNAETYTLSYKALDECFPISLPNATQSHSFETAENGLGWTVGLDFLSTTSIADYRLQTLMLTKPYLNIRTNGLMNIGKAHFSTDGFIGKHINTITVEASFLRADDLILKNDKQTFDVSVDGTVASSETTEIFKASFVNTAVPPVVLTVDRDITELLEITMSYPIGGEIVFVSITVDYDEVGGSPAVAPEVAYIATVPVGHALTLEADIDDADIYYTIDGTEDWLEYDPEVGVVFKVAGTHTLKYYAEYEGKKSEVATEEVVVVKASGLHAALAANNEITVSGEIRGYGDGYVLIDHSSERTSDEDYLAVESGDYPSLQSAAIGTQITATGRATDRFGRSLSGLGSISALSINGQLSVPTGITTTPPVTDVAPTSYYDLQGRRTSLSGKGLRLSGSRKILLR